MKTYLLLILLVFSLSSFAQTTLPSCESVKDPKQAIIKLLLSHGFERSVIDVTDEYMQAGRHKVYFKEVDVAYVFTKKEIIRTVSWLRIIDIYEGTLNFETTDNQTAVDARNAIRCLAGINK